MHELVKDGLEIDRSLLALFDDGFDLKVTADYGDPSSVTNSDAQRTIQMAEAFVARVEQLLTGRN